MNDNQESTEKPVTVQSSTVNGLNDRITAADDGIDNSQSSLIEKDSLINKIKSKDIKETSVKQNSGKNNNKVIPEDPKVAKRVDIETPEIR